MTATFVENLIASRDRYAAKLASMQAAADYRWNEYEDYLVSQIERIDKMIERARTQTNTDESEVISGGFTP